MLRRFSQRPAHHRNRAEYNGRVHRGSCLHGVCASATDRRSHSLHRYQGSKREFHSCPILRNSRFHIRRGEHHQILRPRPGYPPEEEDPDARVFFRHRPHETIYSGSWKRATPGQRVSLLFSWAHHHRRQPQTGAVVTISVAPEQDQAPSKHRANAPRCNSSDPHLTDREKDILSLLMKEGSLGLTDIKNDLNLSPSTAHRTLRSLEEEGLVKSIGKMRCLTDFGLGVAEDLP